MRTHTSAAMLPVAVVLALVGTTGWAQAPAVAPLPDLAAINQAFVQIAQTITPCVVNISTTTVITGRRVRIGDVFGDFFGMGPVIQEPDQEVHSLGSGVIISPDGYILTNNHVIEDAQQIVVTLAEGAVAAGAERELPATVRGTDPTSDIAVIKVAGTGLPAIRWGDSDRLQVGEWVIAIGSPLGLAHSVTAGIISGLGRHDIGTLGYADVVQTDAAINPGNSGGALVNIHGELVAVPTAIMSEGGGWDGVGLAIPANLAQQVSAELVRQGQFTRGWIGVIPEPVPAVVAQAAGTPEGAGLLVRNLYRNAPADKAGLERGDLLVSVNGRQAGSATELVRSISDAAPGSTVRLGYIRLVRGEGGITKTQGAADVAVIAQPLDDNRRPLIGI